MNYEYSDQVDMHVVPMARPGPPPLPGQSPFPAMRSPVPAAAYPPAPAAPRSPAEPLVRPGCVAATSALFFFMSTMASWRFIAALSESDAFGVLANASLSFLLVMIAIGLFRRYRWAVHLLLLYCVVWSVEFIGTQLVALSILNPHVNHPVTIVTLWGVWLGVAGAVLLFPAVGFWWFWRKRRYFIALPVVETWGRAVYALALAVMIAGAAQSVLDARRTMPDQLEPQIEQVEDVDRQMQELW
jgi:hypothetical protein